MAAAIPALLLAALAAPQDPEPTRPPAEVRSLLRSEEPAQRAWGAHRAAAAGDESLTPELLRAWIELHGQRKPFTKNARRHIAVALVVLKADIPPSELARLGGEFPDLSILLAARSPKRFAPVLHALLEQPLHSDAWTACVELLMPFEDPVLTEHLLTGLETRLIVKVLDPSSPAWVAASSSEGERHETVEQPADFPPLVLPTLTRRNTGRKPVVEGLETIYRHDVDMPPGDKHTLVHVHRDAVADRLQRYRYLRHMLVEDAPNFAEHSGHLVTWTDADAFQKTIDELRKNRAEAWKAAIADLVASELLDAAVAERLPPVIRIELEDARAKPSPPLPPVPSPTGDQVRIGRIYWHTSYDDARALARRENKPLLLHFGENPG